MIKILLPLLLGIYCFANEPFINMKNCESLRLSEYTTLVSCHKMDYLIEYRKVDDEEKDTIKRITVIRDKDQTIIKESGK